MGGIASRAEGTPGLPILFSSLVTVLSWFFGSVDNPAAAPACLQPVGDAADTPSRTVAASGIVRSVVLRHHNPRSSSHGIISWRSPPLLAPSLHGAGCSVEQRADPYYVVRQFAEGTPGPDVSTLLSLG
ncbi:hypothetical protein CALVIDRAFT_535845 [Calocera viscosa TUFC12733]|uniref:Uncharacterized protein n=1 Tax=Calocera viscosa (strain TUFC12733) TaxID=1330018 RepID=A0A167NHZ8_CALVF|nr:hypothetical protein CALVIDRAFT_535845 [Calocera viscosa TUFC12733]